MAMYSKPLLISKHKRVSLKHYNDPKAFLEYSNDMDGIYKNIDEHNLGKDCKVLLVFDMIADMIGNKKFNPIVTELSIKGR